MTKNELIKDAGLKIVVIANRQCVSNGVLACEYDDCISTDHLAWFKQPDDPEAEKPYGAFKIEVAENYVAPELDIEWEPRKGTFEFNGETHTITYFRECSWWSVCYPLNRFGNCKTFHTTEDEMRIEVEKLILESIRQYAISI